LEIARFIPFVGGFWIAVRILSLVVGGKIGYLFTSGFHSAMFWIETAMIVIPIIMFATKLNPRKAFFMAMLLCFGGGLYRMNVYLVGFNPGDEWNPYFPSVIEFMLTFGFIALEVLAYIILSRLLKLLPKPHAAGAH
jgi:Ni/Fe-hydrogenase subunit HybB-like protein